MQAKWRSGMVATDDYAEPIANLLRTIDTPLNRATLFSGELGRGPRCCFHASNWIKANADELRDRRVGGKAVFRVEP
jgi:hypothetical protein